MAVATETTASHTRLQAITKMLPDTRTLEVRTAAGAPMLMLVKRSGEWVAELFDPAGTLIGRIRIGGSRRHYTLLDEQDRVLDVLPPSVRSTGHAEVRDKKGIGAVRMQNPGFGSHPTRTTTGKRGLGLN